MIGRTVLGVAAAVGCVASVAVGQSGPTGQWRGVAETMHGPAPLAVAIESAGSGLAGHFEMELFEQLISGGLDRVRREGDSLRFEISFQTNAGPLTFEFAGALVGDSAGGDFAARMPDGSGGAGSWWLRREAKAARPERASRPEAIRPGESRLD